MQHSQSSLLAWFHRHFDLRMPFTRFARNTVLLSLAGLVPALGLYIGLTPDFLAHLAGTDAAFSRFVRQVVTNGLPVVFAINTISVILFARLRLPVIGLGMAMAADFAARTLLFAGLHAAIYFASALMFGSFGGDPLQALRVVGPTLVQAAAFGNLSGVYLYATLVSALPLHMALAELRFQRHRDGPASPVTIALFALAVIGVQLVVLTGGAMAISRLT